MPLVFRTEKGVAFGSTGPRGGAPSSRLHASQGGKWKDQFPEDKNDIEHAYAAAYENTEGEIILYFGIDRMANNGAASLGMWFLQDEIAQLGDGVGNDPFDGVHTAGDVLVQTDFTTGGTIERIDVYMWDCDGFFDPTDPTPADCTGFFPGAVLVGGDLWRVFEGQDCDDSTSDDLACGQVNTAEEDASWIDDGYEYKCVGSNQPPDCAGVSGVQPSNDFPIATFFEGGVNLSGLGFTEVCLAEIVANSRSSQSETSTLDDKALGEFNLCAALRIEKDSAKSDAAVLTAGATFDISPDPTDGVGDLEIVDNGANDEDDTVGVLCISGIDPGTYSVDETSAPSGYGLPTSNDPQNVVVGAGATCTSTDPAPTTVTFSDPPLADIQVNFRDGGSGETALVSPLSCDNATGTSDTTDATGWTDTLTFSDIEVGASEQTITCTIVIDP